MEEAAAAANLSTAIPSSSYQGGGQAQQRAIVDDQDETREHSSSYKASQVAGRFVEVIDPKSHVDTAAPIDSVKGAVSKFGGTLDRSREAQDEVDKVQEEVAEYHKRSQEAEASKAQALQQLGSAMRGVDELRLALKKAQIEEAQERQQWARAELDGVRDRHAAALADLQAARAEVESLQKVRAAAAAEADAVVARARDASAASREAGKDVEGLVAELIELKGDLEASRAAHVGAEEKRLRLALALDHDKSQWQIELEEAQQEAKRLREELVAACDLEMEVEAASQRMASLEAELFACAVQGTLGEEEKPTASSLPLMLDKAEKELEDVKASVERAKNEAKCLRVAAASMRDCLGKEKAELAALRRMEGRSSASIPSLEEELSRVKSELAAAEAEAKAANDEGKMAELVGEARREAEEAKARARSVREEVARAREEAGAARAAVAAVEARLEAVTREILAARTSEEMASASAVALLQESRTPSKKARSSAVDGGVTLTVGEYDELSRRARETEEAAGKRVMEAVKLIKEAKDAEVRSLEKVAKAARQTEQRRQALEAATLEAEEAEFEKLSAERELRQRRAEHEQHRRAAGETDSPRTGLAEISVLDDPANGDGRGNPHILSPRGGYMPRPDQMMGSAAEAEAEAEGKQRKTFFPRMVMYLARRRAQSWK
ncbi:hypothetical protein BS78_01G511300 [Paspalum vaginatum]|nr:hypothetical protein BS78_01G511300 [Paspalum vaginatum]